MVRFSRAYEAAWDSRSKWKPPHLGGEACDSRFSILEGAHTCSPSFPFVPLRHRDLLHRGPQTSLAHRQVHISRNSRTLAVSPSSRTSPFAYPYFPRHVPSFLPTLAFFVSSRFNKVNQCLYTSNGDRYSHILAFDSFSPRFRQPP